MSSKSSSDVDDWIRKAKSLQQDIEESKAVAREIVRDYEQHQELSAEAEEAQAKVHLLETEVLFNQALITSLGKIGAVHDSLETADSSDYELSNFGSLSDLSASIEELPDSLAKDVHHARYLSMRRNWCQSLKEQLQSRIKIEKENEGATFLLLSPSSRVTQSLQALKELDVSDSAIRVITRDFYRALCQPLLSTTSQYAVRYTTEPLELKVSRTGTAVDARHITSSVRTLLEFLSDGLPEELGSVIGAQLTEEVVKVLIRDWLDPSVPANLLELQQYQETLEAVQRLSEFIESRDWAGGTLLKAWEKDVPQTWLNKRQSSALDAVREAFAMTRGPTRPVERIERQVIIKEEEAFAQNGVDDWNADWSDEETKAPPQDSPTIRSTGDAQRTANSRNAASDSQRESSNENSEAWDWNDDDGDEAPSSANPHPPSNENRQSQQPQQREVTLTELYTITDIPDYVLDIVSREIQDAESVTTSVYPIIDQTSTIQGLSLLPSLVLAMFRAISPAYYASAIENGNMHLYNDSIYMNTQLHKLAQSTPAELDQDCLMLEKFARTAYAREMDIQRTILGDLLDGAQGFVNCTRLPYSTGCETAISSTVDRVRAVYAAWKPTLTPSALLQSIGSLLSTVTEKIVKDVEELEDISEPESQRLTSYCSQISALENLFAAEPSAGGGEAESIPPTAIYVANWIRFQYLSNILESSLVDIKYLWVEGELSLEFSTDEVVDLIEALFAESNHRRNAIAEIRRTHMQRAS